MKALKDEAKTLAAVFRDCLEAGKQPTFSRGDMLHIINVFERVEQDNTLELLTDAGDLLKDVWSYGSSSGTNHERCYEMFNNIDAFVSQDKDNQNG